MKHFSELTASATRIVDAAEGLIQDVGYNGFSFEDVAQSVGIRKASVHHHFATKAELGMVVAQRYTHRFREALLHIEGSTAKVPDQLRAYAELFFATYSRDGRLCACGMLGAESESLPDEVRLEVRRFFVINLEWLTAVVEKGVRDGSLKMRRPASDVAQALLAMLEGAMLVGRGLNDKSQGPRKAVEVLLAYMYQ